MIQPSIVVALACALLAAVSAPAAQTADGSLRTVRAARLVSASVRIEAGASTGGLERVVVTQYSPDKQRVARVRTIAQTAESRRSRITVNGPGRRRLTLATVVNAFGLAWSPDGSKIAYSEGNVVTIADSDGRTRTVIHTGPGGRYPGASFDLEWRDRGRVLAFTQVEHAGQLDLSKPVRVSITLGVRPR